MDKNFMQSRLRLILVFLFYCGNFSQLYCQTVISNKSSQPFSDSTAFDLKPALTQFKVVAYIPNWIDLSIYSSMIDYAKITHINIAFENPDMAGDLSYNTINTILINKAHANGVKVLVSIGGGSESESAAARAKYFNLINDANRGGFISKIVTYINFRNFDGIDVDIEGPAINADYGKFIRDLSDSLKPIGKLVTCALSQGNGGANVPSSTFEYFDFVNIMAYDATGPWDKNNPGQHSSYALADSQLKYWKGRGLATEKAILGLPFYGYGFGTAYRNYDYAYSEIVRLYPGAENKDQVGTTIYYNGIHTIKQKTTLAMQQAGGVMIWELSSDASGPKSLLLAIDGVISGTDSIPTSPDDLVATPVSSNRIDLK
jgi:chitinase